MKIALDLDNTINGAPEFWSFMSKLLIDNGHEVHVVTDRDPNYHWEYTKNELEELQISYTKLMITGAKAKYCYDNGIEFAVDDYAPDYYRSRETTKNISPYVQIVHLSHKDSPPEEVKEPTEKESGDWPTYTADEDNDE